MHITRRHTGPLAAAVSQLRAGPDAPPGACVAVGDPAGTTWAAAGVAQAFDDEGPLSTPPPLDLDTCSDAGSVTKLIATTATLMRLDDAGAVDLALPLERFLPWTAGSQAGHASLEQLVQHRAGLWEWWPLYIGTADQTAALRTIPHLPPRYPIDDARHYSDLGFVLLGEVLTESSAGGLADLVRDEVWDPLELDTTAYAGPAGGAVAGGSRGDRIERQMLETGVPYPVPVSPDAFDRWRTHVLVGEVNDGNCFHAFGGITGHAGAFTTASDMLRFGLGVLGALDGSGWVRPATVRRWLTPGADAGQARGWRVWTTEVDGCMVEAFGHTGFPGVATAIIPAHGAAVAMVTNRLQVDGPARSNEDMWLQSLAAAHAELHEQGKESRPWT